MVETLDAIERPLTERWTTVGGLRIFSRVTSPAPDHNVIPIVHVHGFGLSGRYLEPTACRLAAHYPTHVPDLPGHGRSDRPHHQLDIPGLADALAGYLDAVSVPRAVILGNSMGCLVAAEFAHRHPSRIDRAVLVSPAGGPYNQPLPRAISQLVRDGLREPLALARIAIPEYVRFGPANSLRAFHRMTRYPTVARLSALSVPFLVVVGVRDPLVSASRMMTVFRSPAEIALVSHVDSAHAINFSHPKALARVVHAYLQGHPRHELFDRGDLLVHGEDDDPHPSA